MWDTYRLAPNGALRKGSLQTAVGIDVPPLSVAGPFRVWSYYGRTPARCFA